MIEKTPDNIGIFINESFCICWGKFRDLLSVSLEPPNV